MPVKRHRPSSARRPQARLTNAVAKHCKQSSAVDASQRPAAHDARPKFLARPTGQWSRSYKFPTPCGARLPWSSPSDCQTDGRGARQTGKCNHRALRRSVARQWPDSPPPTFRSHPFTCKRFHVLSNSLFKVLFNFPSPYLFTIGLAHVFSLRRSLPPTLSCILKQLDSREHQRRTISRGIGLTPTTGSPSHEDFHSLYQRTKDTPTHHSSRRPCGRGIQCWAFPASLAVTKGIIVIFFSSA